MRYGDGGGLGPAARAKREQVRRQAAALFEQGLSAPEVAARLEVSGKSARAWRHVWAEDGVEALASKGPSGAASRLDAGELARLEALLTAGPAAAGYTEDQRWTLARIAKLISDTFRISYSLKGVSLLLHRLGWTPQMPRHRAAERDEEAIAHWRRYRWPAVKGSRAGWARGSASPTRRDTR
jgi:putative transposase